MISNIKQLLPRQMAPVKLDQWATASQKKRPQEMMTGEAKRMMMIKATPMTRRIPTTTKTMEGSMLRVVPTLLFLAMGIVGLVNHRLPAVS